MPASSLPLPHWNIPRRPRAAAWIALLLIASPLGLLIAAAPAPTTAPAHAFLPPPRGTASAGPTGTWWSLKPVKRPAVPAIEGASNTLNPIDAFILAKLHKNGLSHSPEADRRTLIRRLTFDLHGLPPTPTEINDFLRDTDPQAYEHLVDRLLASPRYGERMGRLWLDVVHYGESDGFGMDRPRMNAWPYRDYVIRSFNQDKPYARFVQEQLAADAMFPDDPAATAALGFIAAGPFNQSALVEQVRGTQCWKIALNLDRDDMVSNVATSFLSVTLHCARCHDHKFDPFTQRDYYRMQSVFAGVTRGERQFDDDLATANARKHWVAVGKKLEFPVDGALNSLEKSDREELLRGEVAAEQALLAAEKQWEQPVLSAVSTSGIPTISTDTDGALHFDGKMAEKDTYIITARTALKSVAALRLEITGVSTSSSVPGLDRNFPPPQITVTAAPAATPDKTQSVSLGKNIKNGKLLPGGGQSHWANYSFVKPVAFKGESVFTIRLEHLTPAVHLFRRIRISLAQREPSQAEIVFPDIVALVKTPRAERSAASQRQIDAALGPLMAQQKIAALPPVHKVFAIGHDLPAIRNYRLTPDMSEIHVLNRGDVNKPMDGVQPGGLAVITALPVDFAKPNSADESPERAALAKWITDPRNPLAWRSIANRIWLWHFDRGIVDTPNDFGKMGTLPSHPELLDWLACELRDTGGSIKHLHRLIVTSATYRQSSPPNEFASKQDADNRLLWRMNRHRVDAEQLRDALLSISGKLDLTMGGPPAMQFSYSDPNVAVTPRVDYDSFDPDSPASYRRSVYRFLFRNTNDPLLEAFDASNPSLATAKRNVTTTALQTLSLFNNKFVLRQCEHLASRLEKEAGDLPGQIGRAYELLYGRPPTKQESAMIGEYAHKFGLAQACRILVNSNEFLFVP